MSSGLEIAEMIVLAGPTASGKSRLALELAAQLDGVIINADSLQLYDALPILTARPGAGATAAAPHRLYGVVAPQTAISAAWWATEAAKEIRAAQEAGKKPILVGGTGLYLEALLDGIAPIPEIAAEIRAEAKVAREHLGAEAFYHQLIERDPNSRHLAIGDTQRVLRAWEVVTATGRPLAEWQQERHKVIDIAVHKIALLLPREGLYHACNRRFDAMIAAGAVEEVAAFRKIYPDDCPAARALGFTALAAYLDGKTTLEQAVELAQAATRHYAKRQVTWFRNRFKADEIRVGV